jgi:hypothetical protein
MLILIFLKKKKKTFLCVVSGDSYRLSQLDGIQLEDRTLALLPPRLLLSSLSI